MAQHRYELKENTVNRLIIGVKHITKDETIASRIALGYLFSLDEKEFFDLAVHLQLIEKDEVDRIFYTPYSKTENNLHAGGETKQTKEDYLSK